MSKLFLPIVLILCGLLCLTGCGSDSDDSSSSATTEDTTTTSSSDSGSSSDSNASADADAADAENAAFSAITPTGLKQTDKFVIAGRGTVFTLGCDSIEGAVSYVFTTSFGGSATSATPSVSLQGTTADGDRSYKATVYALNANGARTKSQGKTLN